MSMLKIDPNITGKVAPPSVENARVVLWADVKLYQKTWLNEVAKSNHTNVSTVLRVLLDEAMKLYEK